MTDRSTECTGFTLRPVAGLLSSRDFLNGLAFRVFHSTQYIRHSSKPLYTPEPYVRTNAAILNNLAAATTMVNGQWSTLLIDSTAVCVCVCVSSTEMCATSCLAMCHSSATRPLLTSRKRSVSCRSVPRMKTSSASLRFVQSYWNLALWHLTSSSSSLLLLLLSLQCYWFTVEFGLCKEGSGVRAFGAGLLSSFGGSNTIPCERASARCITYTHSRMLYLTELEYCLTDKPELRPFDPKVTAEQPYPITCYQPIYFVAESFEDAKTKLRDFAKTLKRPFEVYYNPYTQCVDVLDTPDKILTVAKHVQAAMSSLTAALARQCAE